MAHWRGPPDLAWHVSLKLVGGWITAISAVVMAAGLVIFLPAAQGPGNTFALARVLEVVVRLAYAAHPARFVNGPPVPPTLPTAAWINPPALTHPATTVKEGFDPPIPV